jgi:hypothetical protein
MTASLKILYSERIHKDTYSETPQHEVRVEIRLWVGNSASDVVIFHISKAANQIISVGRECLNGYSRTEAELQRMGIALFDRLIDEHPHFTMGEPDGAALYEISHD